MLYGNPEYQAVRILSIDPGTDTLGVSVFDVDLRTNTKTLIHAFTYAASKYIDHLKNNTQWEMIDEKYMRLHRHYGHMKDLLDYYQPHLVYHENAFMGKFPKAYEGLVQCLYEIRLAVRDYNPYVPLIGLAPMEAKSYIGGISKDQVLRSVSKIKDLQNLHALLPQLDEHAIDSIAIGYTACCKLIEDYKSRFYYF